MAEGALNVSDNSGGERETTVGKWGYLRNGRNQEEKKKLVSGETRAGRRSNKRRGKKFHKAASGMGEGETPAGVLREGTPKTFLHLSFGQPRTLKHI